VELSRSCCVLGCVVRGGSRCARRGRLPTTPQDVFHLRARSSSIHQINPFIPRPSAATAGVPGALGSLSRESAMLQVTVPDGVAEGGQFQANTPSGPRLVTVPPGVKSGQVIEISAPAPMVMEQTELAEASMAMVGTYHNDSSVCCGLGGGTTEVVVTESNQVLTQRIHGRMRFCGCNCGTIEGTGSRGVNDTTMVFTTTSINRGVPTPATNTQTNTQTITSVNGHAEFPPSRDADTVVGTDSVLGFIVATGADSAIDIDRAAPHRGCIHACQSS
jgi:hypothetical protein